MCFLTLNVVDDGEIEFLGVLRVRFAARGVSKVVAGVPLPTAPLVPTMATYTQRHIVLTLLQLIPEVG